MRKALLAISVMSLAGSLCMSAHAGDKTYRWTDAQGRVHYSDVKSAKGEQVQIKPGSSIQPTPKDAPDAVAARQLECQRKKDQLAAYTSSTEITETDSLGKSRSFTAVERQQLLDRTTQQMKEICGEQGLAAQ